MDFRPPDPQVRPPPKQISGYAPVQKWKFILFQTTRVSEFISTNVMLITEMYAPYHGSL